MTQKKFKCADLSSNHTWAFWSLSSAQLWDFVIPVLPALLAQQKIEENCCYSSVLLLHITAQTSEPYKHKQRSLDSFKKKKQSSDQESGRNSSLHVKPFLLSYTFTHAFCPPTRFPRPLLSALCGLVMFLPAVICTVLDRHTGLLFKCLAANAFRVPGGRQNSCRILCFIIFPSSEGRGYHWNKGGGAFPPQTLSTQISGCTNFPGILLFTIHQAHRPLRAIIILYLVFPACLAIWVGRYRADCFLCGWGGANREDRSQRGERTQRETPSDPIVFAILLYNLKYRLHNW